MGRKLIINLNNNLTNMRQAIIKQTILDARSLTTANFTAATTDIITSTAHGLSNGDMVLLTTSDTLPAGLSLNTIYFVMEVTTNTFKLGVSSPDPSTGNGNTVDITDTGTGTHTFTQANVGNSIYVGDFRHKEIVILTSGLGAGDTTTVKVQGSRATDAPNFHLAKSVSNEWEYVNIIDDEDQSTIDGDTGVTIDTSDDLRSFAINKDGLRWVNIEITNQSDVTTSISVFINLYND